jgi:hypothetical protein
MVAYNFMARFAPSVEDGTKRQTIRACGKRRPPRRGEQLQLYTGMRTRNCRLLRTAPCTAVYPIAMDLAARRVRVQTGDVMGELDAEEVNHLAQADGFASAGDFFEYFATTHGQAFAGHLIEWEV